MEPIDRKQQYSDEKLMLRRVADGDRKGFEELYEATYGKVARYVRAMVKDDSTAEDVVIQTYTVAWQKAANFRGEGKVTTWLIGIARNIAFKEFRKQKSTSPFDEAYVAPDEKSSGEAEKKDLHAKMKGALTALSAKHREVLELVFFQELNYEETAKIAGVPLNTVKTRVFHAKKALKDELRKRKIISHES